MGWGWGVKWRNTGPQGPPNRVHVPQGVQDNSLLEHRKNQILYLDLSSKMKLSFMNI